MLFYIPISPAPGQAVAALCPRWAFPARSRAGSFPRIPGGQREPSGRCEAARLSPPPAPGAVPALGRRGWAWIWRESIKSRRETRPPSCQSRRHRTMINPNYYPWGYDSDNGERGAAPGPLLLAPKPGQNGGPAP